MIRSGVWTVPTNRPVTSREYKLMLNIGRFEDRAHGCEEFWRLVSFLAERQSKSVGKVSIEDQNKKEERREVCYLDTLGLALRRGGYALRLRREETAEPDERFKLTLKYRDSDRYAVAAKDLDAVKAGPDRKVKNKFEEDVIPPFVSMFSQSTSIQQAEAVKMETVHDVMELFPGIAELEIPRQLAVGKVGDFTAYEVFKKVGKIRFGDGPKIKCALSFWYLWGERRGRPIVAEFSFDFDDDDEEFPIGTVRGASGLFASVQRQSGWIDFASTTKTAYAYEAL